MTTRFCPISASPALVGTFLTLPCPALTEIAKRVGYDWLLVDLEHGSLDHSQAQTILQAAGDLPVLIRVASAAEADIKRALDLGCSGIVVPQIRSVKDARRAIRLAKFPPAGERSVGIARAHGYGIDFADYVAQANDRVRLILQAEHIDAVRCIDEILALDGIDGIFIGPYDLSGSLNRIGDIGSAPVQEAIAKVKRACKQKAMPCGIFALDAATAKAEIESGCSFVAVGLDTTLYASALQSTLRQIRET